MSFTPWSPSYEYEKGQIRSGVAIELNQCVQYHFDGRFLAVHESFRQNVWSQDLVPLTEFLEWYSVGETLKKKKQA